MTAVNAVIGPITSEKGADLVPLLLDQAREFARHSKAENTLRGYRADWRDFCGWCESHGTTALPATPESVAAYIAECAGHLKVGSIQRRLNAIAEAHKATGLESPTTAGMVRNTLKGIRRTIGTAAKPKAAVTSQTKKTARRPPRSPRAASRAEKLVCRYCGSDDLAPSFNKRRDARCRACFKKRYGSAARGKQAKRVRKAKAAK